jgi:hypothetical protein
MPALDTLFTTVENYDQINIQYLSVCLFSHPLLNLRLHLTMTRDNLLPPVAQFSKIGKVMRHIAALPSEKVPRDDEFKFRERAKVLVDKWHQVLGSNKPNGTETAANGDPLEAVVTAGTAAIDLNGKAEGEGNPPICFWSLGDDGPAESPVPPAEADETLGDVTMSEA